jgi:putative transcriptional regulator
VDETEGMEPSPLRGRLLVANPLLPDASFDRSVVLVLAHGTDGALGVILNRPSDTTLAEVLPDWADAVAAPGVLFSGGPVNPLAVIGVARRMAGISSSSSGGSHDEGETEAFTTVSADIGTVDLDLEPGQVGQDLAAVRVFVGYSGWSAGQLEGEIAGGAWWVVDPWPDDPFGPRPDDLWHDVLRRQPVPLAFVSGFPPDPELN